jgi:DNA polymerase III epsilon subunit-like protein
VDLRLHRKVLVIDVEATGLDPVKNACIEVGAVLLDETLEPIDDYSSLIAPWEGAEFNKESMAVHNISMKELKEARDFHVVIGEFHKRFCSDSTMPMLAGWNVWFDVAFMRALYDRTEIKWPFSHRFLDVQAIVLFFSRLHGPSLEKTVRSLLGEKQTHRAIDDARQTGKVLQNLAGKYLFTE